MQPVNPLTQLQNFDKKKNPNLYAHKYNAPMGIPKRDKKNFIKSASMRKVCSMRNMFTVQFDII